MLICTSVAPSPPAAGDGRRSACMPGGAAVGEIEMETNTYMSASAGRRWKMGLVYDRAAPCPRQRDGENQKKLLSEIQSDMEEGVLLIQKMDLKARSLHTSVNALFAIRLSGDLGWELVSGVLAAGSQAQAIMLITATTAVATKSSAATAVKPPMMPAATVA